MTYFAGQERKILRVFPRRTALTPTDYMAVVGDPRMERPEADEVHVSCTFTWDKAEAERLAGAYEQYYPVVKLGGPAFGSPVNGFEPGMYVKEGVTFTSRGCNNQCPFCLVREREGNLKEYDEFSIGWDIADNNILQCNSGHITMVMAMLRQQRHAARFSGGLEAARVTDWFAEGLRGTRVSEVFLAADHDGALKPLEKAVNKLSFLGRDKLRCYVLIGFNGEPLAQAENRLRRVWEIGCLPFAQLYQPPTEKRIKYSQKWRDLQRTWSRPAATKALMKSAGQGMVSRPGEELKEQKCVK